MIKVAVVGCLGRMGASIVKAVSAADDMELVCGIDVVSAETEYPLYKSLE